MAKTKQKANHSRNAHLLDRFPHIQQITDEKSLYGLMKEYLLWLREHNFSEGTVTGREVQLCELIDWCAQRQVFYPAQVSKQMLDRYQRVLFYKRKANGEPLSFGAQCNRLAGIRVWFRWLVRQDHLAGNPATELQMPRRERRLPNATLSEREIEKVLHQPNVTESLGLRDRALLEVLYSTGIRRSEVARLKVIDVDVNEYTLMVRQGKGKKDRLLPLGERAAEWVKKYLYEARVELGCARDNGELFLSAYGLGLDPGAVANVTRKYIEQAGINKPGACHLFRHAMATLMLENGADIRFIQRMLGHEDIATTELYTQVSLKALREVHSRTHPAAGLKKKVQEADVEVVSLEENEAVLLAMLAAESAEEREENYSSDNVSQD